MICIACEKEFEKLGIEAERVNARKNHNGALGCTFSHIACLQLAKKRNYEHVFICEDDICFKDPELLKTNFTLFLIAISLNFPAISTA